MVVDHIHNDLDARGMQSLHRLLQLPIGCQWAAAICRSAATEEEAVLAEARWTSATMMHAMLCMHPSAVESNRVTDTKGG